MIKIGVIMDPIDTIHIEKDSTFAMLLEAMRRQWEIHYMELSDLFLKDGIAWANMRTLSVQDDPNHWFDFHRAHVQPLHTLDVILMRKDPPVDMEYIYATHLLEQAEAAGVLIVNKPRSLRDANEKLFAAWFPQCCPTTLISSDIPTIKVFLEEQKDIICKPLDGMGGSRIFRLKKGDSNTNVILETLTQNGTQYSLVQRYIPEITEGDKRILVIDGEPVPYALARIPTEGETRANLAVGGKGIGVPLTDRDRWICEQVKSTLQAKGLLFVGLDVIGDYLTEINVTSPTCIRQLDALYSLNISGMLFDTITSKLEK